jgi:hypothetical protein
VRDVRLAQIKRFQVRARRRNSLRKSGKDRRGSIRDTRLRDSRQRLAREDGKVQRINALRQLTRAAKERTFDTRTADHARKIE